LKDNSTLLIISYFCSMKIQSNSVKELRRHYAVMLGEIYGNDEANTLVMMLLEHYFGYNRISLALNPETTLSETEFEKLDSAVNELLTNRPIQYVIGKTEFCGLEFEVNENVLIPRPETEELVSMILRGNEKRETEDERRKTEDEGLKVKGQRSKDLCDFPINILDIGTGSGCIAISLAKFLKNSIVTAIDISEKALEVAKRNAISNGVNVDFIHADILSNSQISKKFDIIVSNPPYVCESEKTNMRANVLDFEPSTALFVDDDNPLIFYSQILKFANDRLLPAGMVWFEINERLGEETLQLCKHNGFHNSVVIKDLFGKDRFIKANRLHQP